MCIDRTCTYTVAMTDEVVLESSVRDFLVYRALYSACSVDRARIAAGNTEIINVLPSLLLAASCIPHILRVVF